MHIASPEETILVLVKFKIKGNLRFLSHAETMSLFQRAIVRGGVDIVYSQGFNPHQRLSLPLPRSVGVEAEDDLLCIKINERLEDFDSKYFMERISRQLPEGIEVLEVTARQSRKPLQPVSVSYVLTVKPDAAGQLEDDVERVEKSEILNVMRDYGKNERGKVLNVRDFLKTITVDGRIVTVECGVTPAGTIRVGEIMELLNLDEEKLAAPVSRTNVQWNID